MRIPKDMPLSRYIRQLIAENNIEQFYQTDDWKELREEVRRELHNECQECLKRGIYTRADCVHHVLELRKHPELGLSKYYIDKSTGETSRNLVPLCNACHNVVHDKLGEWQRRGKFTNNEKW